MSKWPNAQPIVRRVPVPNPGANAEWTVTANTGGTWVVRGLNFQFLTDATVNNRSTRIQAGTDTDTWFMTTANFAQTAGLTVRYSAFSGSGAGAGAGALVMFEWPHEGLVLPNGHTMSTVTRNMQVGDTYSNIILDVVDFPETYPEWLLPVPSAAVMTLGDYTSG